MHVDEGLNCNCVMKNSNLHPGGTYTHSFTSWWYLHTFIYILVVLTHIHLHLGGTYTHSFTSWWYLHTFISALPLVLMVVNIISNLLFNIIWQETNWNLFMKLVVFITCVDVLIYWIIPDCSNKTSSPPGCWNTKINLQNSIYW